MSSSNSAISQIGSQRRLSAFVGLFGLMFLLLFTTGCGEDSEPQEEVVVQEDPVGDFDWVMKQLERRLRPLSGGGISVTDRKVTPELFPPNEQTPHYTATVTVLTKISFLHSRRQSNADEKKELEEKEARAADLSDSLENDPRVQADDRLYDLVDIPGTGSRVAGGAAAPIGTRSREEEAVFHLEYLEGRWQLTEQPENETQREWFEYALQ